MTIPKEKTPAQIIREIARKYDIYPVMLWMDSREMGCEISASTFYNIINYEYEPKPSTRVAKRLPIFIQHLKQKYPLDNIKKEKAKVRGNVQL